MMIYIISLLVLSTSAQPLCDENELSEAMELCMTQFGDLSGDRMNCACMETIPLGHLNCYAGLDQEFTLQEEYEIHCGENLETKEELEKQVGLISSIFGSCGNDAEAHCKDIRSSQGCGHWTTYKSQYRNRCGWWYRYPCDRCCEPDKNIVEDNVAGGRGGVCTCPDGFEYNVGTAANCVNGVVGPAREHSEKMVTCNTKYRPKLSPLAAVTTTGCGDDDSVCAVNLAIDRKLGINKDEELGQSEERNSPEDSDGPTSWSASATVGATFSAGASTRAKTNIKGSVIWGDSGDWNDVMLKVELLGTEIHVDAKLVIGLSAGVELSLTHKMSIGPEVKQSKMIMAGGVPILVSIKAQPVVTIKLSGEVKATGQFTVENVALMTFSDMFISLNLKTFEAAQNLDEITSTNSYSDMYTLDLSGEIGLNVEAVFGVEIDFFLYEVVGVSLVPGVQAKFSAAGSAAFQQRWSSTTYVPPASTTYAASTSICVSSTVETALTWIGDDDETLEEALSKVRQKLAKKDTPERNFRKTQRTSKRTHQMSLRQIQSLQGGKRRALTATSAFQKACHDTMQCTMGSLGSMLASICDIDLSSVSLLALSPPDWFASLEPPKMTIPIMEECWTVGIEDGETFNRAGGADDVDCGGGNTGASCANCMAPSNGGSCGGDCTLRHGDCVPTEEEHSIFPGAVCGKGYAAVTRSWQDCKLAGEALGYPASDLANVRTNYNLGTNRPQGCFMSGENRQVYFNRNNGRNHGERFQNGDAIICKQKVEAAVGYLSMLNDSLGAGPKKAMLIFFAIIGLFTTLVFVYEKAFPSKYKTIPSPAVEEI